MHVRLDCHITFTRSSRLPVGRTEVLTNRNRQKLVYKMSSGAPMLYGDLLERHRDLLGCKA